MYKLMDDGITSFKPFMAHPGVFLAVDATIFRAMSAAETQLSVALYITAV